MMSNRYYLSTAFSAMAKEATLYGMETLEYNRGSKDPCNWDNRIKENWMGFLGSKYGKAANFLVTGIYYVEARPPAPDFEGNLPTSAQYKAIEQEYLAICASIAKDNRKLIAARAPVFNEMWLHTSEDAKAKMRCEPGFAETELARDDPLQISKLAATSLVSAPRGDESMTLYEART